MFSVKVHAMEGVQAAEDIPAKAPPAKDLTLRKLAPVR